MRGVSTLLPKLNLWASQFCTADPHQRWRISHLCTVIKENKPQCGANHDILIPPTWAPQKRKGPMLSGVAWKFSSPLQHYSQLFLCTCLTWSSPSANTKRSWGPLEGKHWLGMASHNILMRLGILLPQSWPTWIESASPCIDRCI